MNRRDLNRILFLMAGFIIVTGTRGFAQGKLEVVGGNTYDWGRVDPARLHTVIKIRNAGTGDLHIEKVQPACSCTIDTLAKDLLKPGEVTDLKLSVDVASRSGAVEKTVTIYSDDPANKQQVITLRAFVKRPVTFEPGQYFYVQGAKVGQEVTGTVTIANSGDAPFTLFPPELDSAVRTKVRFDMTKKKELKPGEKLTLKAFITPTTSGTINDIVRMRSTQKENGLIMLTIYGNANPADARTSSPQQGKAGN